MDTVCSCFFYIYLLTCTFFQISMLFHPSMLYLRWSPSRTSCRGQTYCQRSAPWKATKWLSHGRTEPITCGRAYVSWRARSARSIPIQPIRDDHDDPNSFKPPIQATLHQFAPEHVPSLEANMAKEIPTVIGYCPIKKTKDRRFTIAMFACHRVPVGIHWLGRGVNFLPPGHTKSDLFVLQL